MKPRSHEENQQKLCVLCLRKNNLQKLSEGTIARIKVKILPDIVAKSWYYPKKICCHCSFLLYEDTSGSKIELYRYKYDLHVSTRSQKICQCEICEVARVTLPNLGNRQSNVRKRGRPATSEGSKKQRSSKHCTICLSEVAKGKRHVCTKTQRHNNALRILHGAQQNAGDSIVAAYLREKGHVEDGTISLANIRGRPTHCTINASTPDKQCLTVDDLYLIKKTCSLTTRNTIKLSSILRGMDIAIPPNVPQQITNLNCKLREFYSVTHLPFDCTKETKEGQTEESLKTVVYCNDVEGLIAHVEQERNLCKTNVFYKIGADGGGGSFKITLSIVEKMRVTVKGEKDTGVKKLFLLAVIPGIPEKYCNIAQVWKNLLHLDQIDAIVAGDLKIINVLLGIMGHSSSFPCPYCITSKSLLSKECKEPRTIGQIAQNYTKWSDEGADSKRARYFYNCVQKPLLGGSPQSKTVMLCPPPPLHIILGIINAIYKAVETTDPEVANRWVTVSACQRHSKYGFTGRNCHKLLANRSILSTAGNLRIFRTVMDRFADLFKACLQEDLEADFLQKVEKFAESWIEAELPNSSKFHILRFHVPEFCKTTGTGLGRYGEQATETVHFDFGVTWDTLKVPESSDIYDERLLRSVVMYNSAHL